MITDFQFLPTSFQFVYVLPSNLKQIRGSGLDRSTVNLTHQSKKTIMRKILQLVTTGAFLLSVTAVLGYNDDHGKSKSGILNKPVAQTRGANCAPANYRLTMDFNDVSCQLETGGLVVFRSCQ